ncbi:uncharacterized protein LOC143234926 [Tachypleus tridentatus]|uniref:uncharacterized protein LOC143234926 n=1 Tax=Tachypleus tridentatus TaxID=6853 RepID=UPI003FD61D1D
MAQNPVGHARTKHIDIRYHFIRQCVQNGSAKLEYCPTNKQGRLRMVLGLSDDVSEPLESYMQSYELEKNCFLPLHSVLKTISFLNEHRPYSFMKEVAICLTHTSIKLEALLLTSATVKERSLLVYNQIQHRLGHYLPSTHWGWDLIDGQLNLVLSHQLLAPNALLNYLRAKRLGLSVHCSVAVVVVVSATNLKNQLYQLGGENDHSGDLLQSNSSNEAICAVYTRVSKHNQPLVQVYGFTTLKSRVRVFLVDSADSPTWLCYKKTQFLAAKGIPVKEAIKIWETKSGKKAAEATELKLIGQQPPIDKLDASLSTLANCEKLSLSTNCIEKLTNLNGLKNLRILSLGRNWIKSLAGLEAVGDSLEELWISYNLIEKLKGINVLKKLQVLYMSNNLVKDWAEFQRLTELPVLEDLVFVGNPLEEKHSQIGDWKEKSTIILSHLKKLDGFPVIRSEDEEEKEEEAT